MRGGVSPISCNLRESSGVVLTSNYSHLSFKEVVALFAMSIDATARMDGSWLFLGIYCGIPS